DVAAWAPDAFFGLGSPSARRLVVDHASRDQTIIRSPANVVRPELLQLRSAKRFVRSVARKGDDALRRRRGDEELAIVGRGLDAVVGGQFRAGKRLECLVA